MFMRTVKEAMGTFDEFRAVKPSASLLEYYEARVVCHVAQGRTYRNTEYFRAVAVRDVLADRESRRDT